MKIKKLSLLLIIVSLIMCALPAASCSKNASQLNIFTYADYVPQEVIDKFEKATGIKVNYTTFESDEDALAKMNATKGKDYDIVICGDYAVSELAAQDGMLQPLDKSRIPNYSNIDTQYQNQYYDPQNLYSVPYTSGGAILVYNPDKVPFPITSFADLWDSRLANSIVVVDEERTILGMTMLKLGYSVNSTDTEQIQAMSDELMKLRGNIIGFDADTPQTMMINGEASVGYMYGSQVTAALEENPNLKVVYPSEGIVSYIDNVVVPARAADMENAYTFINYILQPDISAEISEIINYPNCTNTPDSYFSSDYLNNAAVHLPDGLIAKSQMVMNLDANTETAYNRIWTEFKSK